MIVVMAIHHLHSKKKIKQIRIYRVIITCMNIIKLLIRYSNTRHNNKNAKMNNRRQKNLSLGRVKNFLTLSSIKRQLWSTNFK
jgi:hypothetical protein